MFNVKRGDVDGTDVSGLTVAGGCGCSEGHERGQLAAGVFIDAAASDEQADKLARCSLERSAARWRRWGLRSASASAWSARRSRCSEDGLRHSVRIGDAVDFEIEDVVPFGVETGEPVQAHRHLPPGGLRATMAQATRSKIDALRYRLRGERRPSPRREFSWAA